MGQKLGPLIGFYKFASLKEIHLRDFLKGGSAVFVFSFQGRLNVDEKAESGKGLCTSELHELSIFSLFPALFFKNRSHSSH